MKIRYSILAVIIASIACSSALADRELERAEILQIFQTLTAQPRDTWISAGTIEATHHEFKPSNGYTMDSTVIVKYDGDRFYWEINIDSQVIETEVDGKPFLDDSDLEWNKKRVFAWDGQRYTMYFRPGNDAIVTESPGSFSGFSNGPLTAGIVPWGYGFYTYQELFDVKSSAIEVEANGQKQIHLTLKDLTLSKLVFVLDPTKDYAVLSCSIKNTNSSISQRYGHYKKVSGRWIPTTITTERYGNRTNTPELTSYDYWEFTSIDTSPPQEDSFTVKYEAGAFIEYYSSFTDRPLSYCYSDYVDIESLLQNRLMIASAHDGEKQNCATVVMKYVAEKLGNGVNDLSLAGLVHESNKQTSLYELKQFARKLGFHCLAVKTDIRTFKTLKNCQAILHLPREKHYVVLGHIDDEYAWIVDLDNDKFYYRIELELFTADWNGGTLLVSNEPLNLEGYVIEINDEKLHEIVGADDGFGTYSCTDMIQDNGIIHCEPPIVFCNSVYHTIFRRYACIEDPDGGYCTGKPMIGSIRNLCLDHPYNPGACETGDPYSRYIRACK